MKSSCFGKFVILATVFILAFVPSEINCCFFIGCVKNWEAAECQKPDLCQKTGIKPINSGCEKCCKDATVPDNILAKGYSVRKSSPYTCIYPYRYVIKFGADDAPQCICKVIFDKNQVKKVPSPRRNLSPKRTSSTKRNLSLKRTSSTRRNLPPKRTSSARRRPT